MGRAVKIAATAAVALVLVYLSQFWVWRLWSRDGLFGIEWIRPGGNLVSVWLRGTPFAPFALPIWAMLVFVALTWLERCFGWLSRGK
jgi:hypothetical protein